MGKGGRIACIFTPWAMTIVAMVLQVIVQLGGKTVDSTLLNSVHAWQADFSAFKVDVGLNDVELKIGAAFQQSINNKQLQKLYQIHVYNYCSASTANGTIDKCSDRYNGFIFNPITDWHLDGSVASSKVRRQNAVTTGISNALNNTQTQAEILLGDGVAKALSAYMTASKWMSIAFEVALWTSVGTAVAGILAIFSRIGSFITWFLSFVSTFFTVAAALTSTIIFGALVAALKAVLNPLHVNVSLGTTFLIYVWLSALLSAGATTFWLMSVCCCSGKSNPHHKGHKGGLWNSEDEKYGGASRGSMRLEQTGGSYQRVASPYVASERVPLHDYPQTPAPHSTAQFPAGTGYGEQKTAYGQQGTAYNQHDAGYAHQNTGYGQQSAAYGQQGTAYGHQDAYGQHDSHEQQTGRYEPYSYKQ